MVSYRPPEIDAPEAVTSDDPVISDTPYGRVIFGHGAAELVGEVASALGSERPALLCTPGRTDAAERLLSLLPSSPVLIAEAVMHTPVAVSDAAADTVARHHVDLLVSIGGGSAIGLGKALTNRLGLRHIALPTTYAGSEITPILGESRDGDKLTSRDDALRPAVVIYDPALSASLPPLTAAASGMNALAHSVEALTTSNDPDIVAAATRSIGMLAKALPEIIAEPDNPAPRARALYAAWLAAYCLAEVPMALHHKLCHALGGTANLPHAQTHAIVLPHAAAYNLAACPDAAAILRKTLGGEPAGALFDLVKKLGLPTGLAEIGLAEEGIAVAAQAACANPYANPRAFDEQAITRLLRAAWLGSRPLVEDMSDA